MRLNTLKLYIRGLEYSHKGSKERTAVTQASTCLQHLLIKQGNLVVKSISFVAPNYWLQVNLKTCMGFHLLSLSWGLIGISVNDQTDFDGTCSMDAKFAYISIEQCKQI